MYIQSRNALCISFETLRLLALFLMHCIKWLAFRRFKKIISPTIAIYAFDLIQQANHTATVIQYLKIFKNQFL